MEMGGWQSRQESADSKTESGYGNARRWRRPTADPAMPSRVDLRTQHCVPYLMAEDQGDVVSCVSHAFGMAYYCSLRRVSAPASHPYPRTTEVYMSALGDGGEESKGVSFEAVKRQLAERHAAELSTHALEFVDLPNSAAALKEVLHAGFPVVVGYQVSAAIERFHRSAGACREHGFILPRFAAADSEVASGHTVLVVGFDDDVDGFIGRNSWGRDWGSDGHFLVRYADVEDPDFFTDITCIVSKRVQNGISEKWQRRVPVR